MLEIKPITDYEKAADVIRKSFETVAREFNLTKENCPYHTSFITHEKLLCDLEAGAFMYGIFLDNEMIGFVEIKPQKEKTYTLEKLAVLPEHRHISYGKKLLSFAKDKVRELGGDKIEISIIEENTILKEFYLSNGFLPTRTEKNDFFPFTVGFMETYLN